MKYDFALTVRCKESKLNLFKDWCRKVDKEHHSFVREIMDAAPQGRVTIKPTKEIKELYDEK